MEDVPQIVEDWWNSLTEREQHQWELIAKNEINRINHEKENDIYER